MSYLPRACMVLNFGIMVCVACSGGGDGAGGAGGLGSSSSSAVASSSTSAHSSSAKATSSSSGGIDGGSDGGCSTCSKALNGSNHEDAILHLCAGSEASISWASFISCTCAKGGSCESDCGGTPFCAGVFPEGGVFTDASVWTDPAGTCLNCIKADGSTGCGDFALQCNKT